MATIFAPQPPGESFGGVGVFGPAPQDFPVDAGGSSAAASPPPVFVFGQAMPSDGVASPVSRPAAKKERAPIGGKPRKAPNASAPSAKPADATASTRQQQTPVAPRPQHHQHQQENLQRQQPEEQQQHQQQPQQVAEEPKPPASVQPRPFQFGGSSSSSSRPPQDTSIPPLFTEASFASFVKETTTNPFASSANYCHSQPASTSSSSPFVFGLSAAPPAAAEGSQLFGSSEKVNVPDLFGLADGNKGDGESATSWSANQSKLAEAARQQATGHMTERRYGDAVQVLLPALDGDSAALALVRQCVTSWLKSERQLVVNHDSEKASMQVQLNAARDRAEELRRRKDELLAQERRLRMAAEQKVVGLQNRIHGQLEENIRLRQQLQRAESKGRGPPRREEVVSELAKLECLPLRKDLADSDRAALKKKLLLKWHPDKQPSAQCTDFATQIMQELQNRPEWSW